MRAPLRETGSILVPASRDRVYEALAASLAQEPALRVEPGARVEAGLRTFVLKDAPGGTRVIHALAADANYAAIGKRPRETLREQVEMELFRLQKRFE